MAAAGMAQLASSLSFNLANPLAVDGEVLADLFQRVLAAVVETEAWRHTSGIGAHDERSARWPSNRDRRGPSQNFATVSPAFTGIRTPRFTALPVMFQNPLRYAAGLLVGGPLPAERATVHLLNRTGDRAIDRGENLRNVVLDDRPVIG
jgi:hypothetical protein